MSTEFFNDQWRIPSNENQNKVSNYSMEFDGTNQSINLGSDFPYPSVSTDPWSISFWIKPNSATSSGYIFSTYDVSGIRGFYVNLRSGGTNNDPLHVSSLMRAGTTGYSAVATSDPIAVGEWQHIVVAFNGAFNATLRGITIYVNGSPVSIYRFGNVTTNGSLITSVNKYIGQREDNSNYLTNCELDQVTFFDYELSQEQVTQLGAEGYAFNFNGSTQAIDCGTGSRFDIDQITISAWVNLTSGKSSTKVIAGIRNTNNGLICYHLQNQGSSSKFRFVISQEDGNYVDAVANDILQHNTWYHLVAVADGSNVKLYVNGDLQTDQKTYDGTITSPTQNFNIGRQPSNPLYYWDGELSNISVFNTGLSSTDVQTLYNNGKPGDISSLNPVGWWKLDDTATFNSGTSVWTIPDDSTNSNNGTSVGPMTSSSLVASNINGELIANPMITSPKPIAYYQLGDQSVDNGANLLVPNNSLSDYVFNFDGTDDYIDTNSTFNTLTSFTVSAWFKLDSISTVEGIASTRINGIDTSKGFDIFINVNGLAGRVYDNGVTEVVQSFTDTTSWHNVVMTYNGTTLELFLDNLSIGTATGNYDNSGGRNLTIGKWGPVSAASYYFDGLISNVSIFNTALSTANIENIYNNGAPNDISSLSPVGWWKLDSSEIFNSTSTEWSVDNNAYPSVYQSSLDFNGSSNYIDCGDADNLSFGNETTDSPFSISAWINMDNNASFRIVNKYDAPNYEYQFDTGSSGELRFFVLDGTGYRGRTGSTLNTGQWYHVVATYNGVGGTNAQDGTKIYVNGANVIGSASTFGSYTAMSNTTAPVYIGRIGASYSNGEISNAAIFNTELTSTEVATLYNNGTPEASISHSPVSWWKLDNTTTGVQDSAGSNNGTNNGATEYAGFVNALAGESSNMDSSNLVVSDLQQTSGYSPYALDFDGVDDYLTITSTDFKGSGGTVSYSFWVKPETYGNPPGVQNFGYFISDSSTGGGIAYSEGSTGFGLTPGQMYLYNITNAGAVPTLTSTIIEENIWNNIIVVFNTGNIVQFYKNGSLSSTLTGITSYNATFDTIAARRYPGGVNNPLNGDLSNFSIFDTALTSTQVTEIYNEGVPSNLNTFSGTAPVAWWQIGSNSSYNSGAWTCLDEIGTNNAVSAGGMTNSDIVDGPGYSASGVGNSSIDIKGDAPYSTANGLSKNMDVLDRTLDTPIRNTHSIQLDGVDDYIDFGNVNIFERTDAFSGSCWVFNEGSSINQYIISKRSTSRKGYVIYFNSAGALVFILGPGPNSNVSQVVGPAPSTNTWNHLAFTYDGSSTRAGMKLYINGTPQSLSYFGQSTITGTIKVPSIPFQISGEAGITDNVLNGKIDEVAMFNSELSAPQVASIYNNGTPGNILPLNPVSWHRFESLTTNGGVVTTADSSGNGLTGTVENGASLSTVVP